MAGRGRMDHRPEKEGQNTQVTLEAIRSQIFTKRAMIQMDAGHGTAAINSIYRALSILTSIGNNSQYSPILELADETAIGGWFKSGYNALKSITEADDHAKEACEAFLRHFTFNYC